MTESQAHLLVIFVGILAGFALLQAIVLAAVAVAAAGFFKKIVALTDEAKVKFYPIADTVGRVTTSVEGLIEDSAPKIRRVTSNIADTTDVYRAKVAEINTLITDTTRQAGKQRDRVDSVITHFMDRTGELVDSVQNGVMTPFRQASGLISGLRAGVETLVKLEKEPTIPKPRAFEGRNIHTGLEDDYHA